MSATHQASSPSPNVTPTPTARPQGARRLLRRPSVGMLVPFAAFLLLFVTFSIATPSTFLQWSNFETVLYQTAILAVVAFGMTFVIVAGSIDLSVGSLVGVTGVVFAMLSTHIGDAAIIVAILLGVGLGLVNGTVFAILKIPSFIVTLGMLEAARGLTIMLSHGTSQQIETGGFGYSIGLEPDIFIVLAIVGVIVVFLFRATLFGRRIQAIGGNERVARIAGIPVTSTKILAFVLSGCLAGLGGVMLASQTGLGDPTAGTNFELDVISAVVIGGTPLTGGVGRITGTFIGAIIISMVSNGLILLGVGDAPQLIIKGGILTAAVLVSLERKKIGVIK